MPDYMSTDRGPSKIEDEADRMESEIRRRRKLFSYLGSPIRYEEEEETNEGFQSQDDDGTT